MLIVAGLSLGLAVFEVGAARWLAWVLLGQIAVDAPTPAPGGDRAGRRGAAHMFSSNTVTASIIMPILVALAKDLHLDAWATVAPAAFTSSLAFILVSEGPTTIIPYSSGYFSIKDMAKAGMLMTMGLRSASRSRWASFAWWWTRRERRPAPRAAWPNRRRAASPGSRVGTLERFQVDVARRDSGFP